MVIQLIRKEKKKKEETISCGRNKSSLAKR
jgi:hypothetical protein